MPNPATIYATSEGMRFNTDLKLEVVVCPSCFVTYAIPESFLNAAQSYPGGKSNGGWSICCPFGHSWHFRGKSIEQQLKEERRKVQAQHDRWLAERDLRRDTERRLSAQKGATTKARKRHAAGVCPCCQRSFQQLRRHMESQHPDYDPAKHSHGHSDGKTST